MNLNKYQNLFFKKLHKQFTDWFEADEEGLIPQSEVYNFLHSIKGTAGTLELWKIHRTSVQLMIQVKDLDRKNWQRSELKKFLNELLILAYDNEFLQEEAKNGQSQLEMMPLIQIIGDEISDLIQLRDFLEKKGWMVFANSTLDKVIAQYHDLNPDCIIIDINFSNQKGLDVINALQQYISKQFVPIIMISILNDSKTRIQAFKAGVDDFLGKPFDFEELAARIEHHLQRKQMYDKSALLDELTNLYNRRYLKIAYNRYLNDLKRKGQPFCLAMLDLDYFKKINDTYGHQIGDRVLAGFASFLAENTRNNDLVFRYGGEEFTILLQNIHDLQASEIILRLLHEFSQQSFDANGETFSLTFSAGIYMINNPETTIEDALNVADQALYKAKELGRARAEYLSKSLNNSENRKLFISVIDDDPIIRIMLMRNLQLVKLDHYDIDVQVFENGLAFFDSNRLQQHGEHFLILDGVMPDMDGLEILEKVKQNDFGNNILVMMLTGRNSKDDIARALELGADDYMTKPFNMENLQLRIKQLIHRMNH